MNQIEALQRLRTLETPVVESRDVAALLQVSRSNATTILRRLGAARDDRPPQPRRWLVDKRIDRLALPELISAPYPAYVSLQSALFHHGLIEQIPSVLYAVTPIATSPPPDAHGRPFLSIAYRRNSSRASNCHPRSDAKIAIPEKALFDLFYLAPGRSRVFSKQPELTIPRALPVAAPQGVYEAGQVGCPKRVHRRADQVIEIYASC